MLYEAFHKVDFVTLKIHEARDLGQ